MKINFEIKLLKNTPGIKLQYVEEVFSPTENTGITLYNDYKISIMLSDGMFAVTNNIAYKSKKGDFFIFRPDEIHFARITDTKTHKFLNIFVPADFFKNISVDSKSIEIFLNHNHLSNLISPNFENKEKLLSAVTPIIEKLKSNTAFNNIDIFSQTLNVLLMLRDYSNISHQGSNTKDIPFCVTNTLDFITKNYSNKISLKELARQSYCSVAYLSKTFKEQVGCTVYEQLTNYRIANAKIMLKEGKSVTETCFDCGFTDCSHFIKTFKKLTDTTPYKYKQAE